MSAEVVLYCRTDVAWWQLTEEMYLEQHKYNQSVLQLTPYRKRHFFDRLCLWNRRFSLSFFDYRQCLKDIASANHSRLQGVDLVVRNRKQYALLKSLPKAIVIPADDDDWFAPHVANSLRVASQAGVDLLSWNDVVFRPAGPDKHPHGSKAMIPRNTGRANFWTNNYAITAHGIQSCPASRLQRALNDHTATLRTFRRRVPEYCHKHLSEVMSATVKSPASFSVLNRVKSVEALFTAMLSSVDVPLVIPPECRWAEPFARQVEDLNRRLANSARLSGPTVISKPSGDPNRLNASAWLQTTARRTGVINSIARRFGYSSYLEIGCGNNRNFGAIQVSEKTGVDPRRGGTHCMTSDDFFLQNNAKFDLIFIDGLHLQEQVLRDIDHSLGALNEHGCILVHDCLPGRRSHQLRAKRGRAWTGDVWKALVKIRMRADVDAAVLNYDWGIAAIVKRPNTAPLAQAPPLTWNNYVLHRDHLLRVSDAQSFEQFLTGHPQT